MKKLFEKKRHRGGNSDEKNNGAFYKEISLEDFVRAPDPYLFLQTVHWFLIDDKVKDGAFKIISPPTDIEEICKDV